MLREFRIDIRANNDPSVTFAVSRTERKQSDLIGKATLGNVQIDVTGVYALAQQSQRSYLRLCFVQVDGAKRAVSYGKLFQNDRKVEGSRQPDFTGEITVDLATKDSLRIAGWQRFDKPGDESTAYIAISVEEKRAQSPASASSPA
ncbi:hypothetical protein [Burkholderia sp. MBR-1]|uniref:hypothetical protein n=1 Tax=Burkholderia sp. MBR-1 TaxID=2732364 RepID=UPI0015EFCCBD|nr:hypothetical protein [Burkholderia sp. MBR-1]QMI49681.1 hypothetical protein MBR110_29795 [Burkholderia sp. MBR-1]